MFGGPFNRLPFNRPADFTRTIYGGGTVNIDVEVLRCFLREMRSEPTIEVPVEVLGAFVRQMVGVPDEIEVTVEVQSSFTREFQSQPEPVNITVQVLGNGYRTHTDTITFTGIFAPGDKIIIDSDRLKMTKNGQNALEEMTGDFFDLNIGNNEIRYTDDQEERSILTRVTFPDKFV